MHALLLRLESVAAKNQQLQMELENEKMTVEKLEREKQCLAEENRVSRLSMRNLGLEDELGTFGKPFEDKESEEEKRRKRQEKHRKIAEEDARERAVKERDLEMQRLPPEIEMQKVVPSTVNQVNYEMEDLAQSPFKSDEECDTTIQQELAGLGDEGGIESDFMNASQLHSGDEYFETNPNDNSYEMIDQSNDTNRDLLQ